MAEILVVDDDDMIRKIMAKCLNAAGFEVTESPDGDDALKKLQSHILYIQINQQCKV